MKIFAVILMATSVICIEDLVLQEFAQGNNDFSSKLHKELSKSNAGNLIVSPLSAETVLALTALGAKGETASELLKALSLPSDPQKIKEQFSAIPAYMKTGRFSTLNSANKIYIEQGFGIAPEFLNIAMSYFGSNAENVNFGEAEKTAQKINQWVEGQTNGKIKELVGSDLLNELTRVVLVNALYFKGQWLHQFKKENTKPMDFHKTKSETVQVDAMENIAYLRNAVNEELKAKFVELPYRGSEVTLTIVIPNEIDGLSSLEDDMDSLLRPQNFTKDGVKLILPKFKVETSFNLVHTLQNLGVKKLFNRDADLSGMSIKEGLYVSNVVQKVFINVDEIGTEAAAATAVISNARSAVHIRQSKIEIKVDRPFLFFLKLHDVVLFSGKITTF